MNRKLQRSPQVPPLSRHHSYLFHPMPFPNLLLWSCLAPWRGPLPALQGCRASWEPLLPSRTALCFASLTTTFLHPEQGPASLRTTPRCTDLAPPAPVASCGVCVTHHLSCAASLGPFLMQCPAVPRLASCPFPACQAFQASASLPVLLVAPQRVQRFSVLAPLLPHWPHPSAATSTALSQALVQAFARRLLMLPVHQPR